MTITATDRGTTLGALVRACRERASLTQEQLAERSGMSARSIRRLESGDAARPRSSSLESLATALDLSEAERSALIGAVRGAGAVDEPDRSGADPLRPPPRDPPRQLPAPPPAFTGRLAESADLGRIQDPSAVVITSIDGMAGVGKTALAVHAAHRIAGHYPDGQLFLDLHGYTEGVAPVDPGDALDRMLRALGVPGDEVPRDVDDRAACYRSRMAGRRVLVLLDNAASEAQVAPLLPGAPGCLVVVTSRRRLAGLDHTHGVSLDVLPPQDAIALFASTAGEGRTAGASAEALAEVVELCGRLPLAVRIAGARLRARPAWSVENVVDKLRDQRRRLAELETGSRSVAAALESSYQDLDPEVQRGYRLLGLQPGGEFDSYVVAALLDADVSDADRLIHELIEAHLLQEPEPDRFGFHDLVRDHARASATRHDGESARRAAVTRLLDHHRHAASAAMDVAYPHERSRRPDVPRSRTPVPAVLDPVGATAWLEGALPNLVAAARHAAAHGWPDHASHLGATLHRHLYDHGHGGEAMTLHQHALLAARAAGDRRGEADALVLLGKVHWWFHSRLEHAAELFELAAATAHDVGHHLGEVRASTALGAVRSLQGQYERATDRFAAARAGVRHVSDHAAELDALYFLAWHHLRHGEPARDEFEQCLAFARAHGDRNGEWLALHGLGYAHQTGGAFERAIECFGLALRISRAVADHRATLGCLIGLAYAHRQEGHEAPAASFYQQAIDLAREVGNPNWEAEAVHGLGRLACAAGRAERALALFGQALGLAARLGRPVADVRAHDGLAHAYRLVNERDHARRHWQRALEILTDLGLTDIGTDIGYDERITTEAIRTHLDDL